MEYQCEYIGYTPVSVDRQDINNGEVSCSKCPIALALWNVSTPMGPVQTTFLFYRDEDISELFFKDGNAYMVISDEVEEWIMNFDRNKENKVRFPAEKIDLQLHYRKVVDKDLYQFWLTEPLEEGQIINWPNK